MIIDKVDDTIITIIPFRNCHIKIRLQIKSDNIFDL